MDIRQLHYFLVLCEEMNYTRAPSACFIPTGPASEHLGP